MHYRQLGRYDRRLAQARRIIGSMWDELPVSKPQAVIEHRSPRATVVEGRNFLTSAIEVHPIHSTSLHPIVRLSIFPSAVLSGTGCA